MKAKRLSYTQAVYRVVGGAGEPMPFASIMEAVLEMPVRPSPNPRRAIRGALRRSPLVTATDGDRYASTLWLLKGTAFRHDLAARELQDGCLRLGVDVSFALYPFLFAPRTETTPRPCNLYFEQGPFLSLPLVRLEDGSVGIAPREALADWFRMMQCAPGDDLIFEVNDGEEGLYHIFVEPEAEQNVERVKGQSRQVAEAAVRLLARKRVPCPLVRLMPALVAAGLYGGAWPPLPLEMLLRSDRRFEVRDGKVRLVASQPSPGLLPAVTTEARRSPGVIERLFGRRQ